MTKRSTRRARKSDPTGFRPISDLAEVRGLVDRIVGECDDDQALAFVHLLEGIAHAYHTTDKLPDVEHIVVEASARAFAKTTAFGEACHEFAQREGAR